MDTFNVREDDSLWSSIPTSLLRAELARRAADGERPACGSSEKGAYDTGIHVFALFLVLVISTLACGFPLFSQRFSTTTSSPLQRTLIFLCQHFGTGVLLATAFVHLLPTAFTSLTDPCLPPLFNEQYPPLAGLIAMVSALVVVALESYLTTRGVANSCAHHHTWDGDGIDEGARTPEVRLESDEGRVYHRRHDHRPGRRSIALDDLEATQGLVAGASPLAGSTPTLKPSRARLLPEQGISSYDVNDRDSIEELDVTLEELRPNGNGSCPSRKHTRTLSSLSGSSLPVPTTPEEQRRMMLQCMLLEAGILFHSVFIGMALSVATGPAFVVFLIAICFHQSFEGLALGTRIAALHFPRSSPRPWLMVLAFGATTPVGQAIGLLVHGFYDPQSQAGLLMVGVMNAISAGLLLFAGLVQLLAEDFLSEKSYKVLRGRRRVHAFCAVAGGAALMAVVGAFA